MLGHPEEGIQDDHLADFMQKVERVRAGEALPYVLGWWEFFGRRFYLNPAVLIPRPETELLIETALSYLNAFPGRRSLMDVGTGSGCIAVTLAAEVGSAHVLASDSSHAALLQAKANAVLHGVEQYIHFVQADLLSGISGRFDLVCANLPYVPTDALRALPVSEREPGLALDGGAEGLSLIERLLRQLPGALSVGGRALLEIDASHGQKAMDCASRAFPKAELKVIPDLAGRDRLLLVDLG